MEVPLKKKNYAQKYRKEWESLSEFQTWLKHLPEEVQFRTEHSSVSCIDHLSDLVKSVFPDSKATDDLKIHRTKCTEIIKNVLAPHFVEELLKDIGQQKYSLITSKQLGIVIRYFSRNLKKVVSPFLALEPLKACDAVES
ncbi:hypothetical protein ACJJTC_010865 [Scirpophaga incertulas]